MDQRLTAIEDGADHPRTAAEAFALAEHLGEGPGTKRSPLAYRLFLIALADETAGSDPIRYNAACAAVRFAAGDDAAEKSGEKQRLSLRKQGRASGSPSTWPRRESWRPPGSRMNGNARRHRSNPGCGTRLSPPSATPRECNRSRRTSAYAGRRSGRACVTYLPDRRPRGNRRFPNLPGFFGDLCRPIEWGMTHSIRLLGMRMTVSRLVQAPRGA